MPFADDRARHPCASLDITTAEDEGGPVLLLPDPPDVEAMSLAVAERFGAETARLDVLKHCWIG
jgi:hypothetical protein